MFHCSFFNSKKQNKRGQQIKIFVIQIHRHGVRAIYNVYLEIKLHKKPTPASYLYRARYRNAVDYLKYVVQIQYFRLNPASVS